MKKSLQSLSGALFASAIAGTLWAQAMAPDWIPEPVVLPEDIEVMVDRAVGSTVRMFSFRTAEPVAAMMERWRGGLVDAGYTVAAPIENVDRLEIIFSGHEIQNAQIVLVPSPGDGMEVVQMDATLNN